MPQDKQRPELRQAIGKRFLQLLGLILFQALLLFGAAGRLDWILAWRYLGLYTALILLNAMILLPSDPELIAERSQVKQDTKGWDKVLTTLMSILSLVTLVVAGLDVRYGWQPDVAPVLSWGALALMAVGFGCFSWAMKVNHFFASTVRIQHERAHTVVTAGPYHYVRHPGYVGLIITLLAMPLLLGSWWAYLPALLEIIVIIIRTALEDRTLQAELVGYSAYTAHTHYRLLPGIW